ncbi:hypothetical protein V1477_020537 [Vespula maculifrons]|uniref:Uncharacterized protein n=1 Tax=Vespula maculifrons TaxID=7453 RepID=A0ABD2AN24_VESMC
MPFRFGSFGLLSKLEMYKTPLTDCSTVHTVGFKHLETRPVVSIIQKILENSLKYAVICSVILASHKISMYLQVSPTQVPPRGGCCTLGPTG